MDYIVYRKTSRAGRYKLRRRTRAIIDKIACLRGNETLSILDIGTADGAMLGVLKSSLSTRLCVGIEPSSEFIRTADKDGRIIIRALAENMPFKPHAFDIIIAASVLDHMVNPGEFLKEASSTLKNNGLLIISLVGPLYDKMAVKFRIKEDDHRFHFGENRLREFLNCGGFNVLESSRFALPFFGIFFENIFEKIIRKLRLGFLMFYIIAVAKVEE